MSRSADQPGDPSTEAPRSGGGRVASALAILLGAVGGLSAIGGLYLALLEASAIQPFLAAFCVVSLVAVGVLIAQSLRGLATAPGLSLLNASGALLTAAVFGYVEAAPNLPGATINGWAAAHAGVALAIGVLAVGASLARRPASIARALIGAAMFLPATALAVFAWRTGFFGTLDAGPGSPGLAAVRLAAVFVGSVVVLVFVSVGGHQIIGAFERIDPPAPRDDAGPAKSGAGATKTPKKAPGGDRPAAGAAG
ncbi:MAG: hypothetical protein AAFR38_11835 [Planctomycetota bacterium]